MPNKRDHAKLICDIGELSDLFADAPGLEFFLQRIVEMISTHMDCPVCSIYLYYEDTDELVLKATKGLNSKSIGTVKMKLGEGLTGLALKELRPICERNAGNNPHFKRFPGIGEEEFESFLVVPILRGSTKIGAMVIQNSQRNYFTEEDVKIFRAITSQLATTIETAKLLMSFKEEKAAVLPASLPPVKEFKFFKGRAASEGFAFSEAVVLGEGQFTILRNHPRFSQVFSLNDFYQAIEETGKELEGLQEEIEERLSDVASLIFSAQILMLKDKGFIEAIVRLIESGVNPPQAVLKVVDDYVAMFNRIPNAYLREKNQDVKDIGRRILENLLVVGEMADEWDGRIVIAQELLPSDALKLSSQNVKGIILLSGGVTSHLAVLVRSLGIPLIIADAPEFLHLPPKTKILMDAEQGTIYINPLAGIIKQFKDREELRSRVDKIKGSIRPATETKDGVRVALLANINLLGDFKAANEFKAEGVGLYRTEFPFIVRSDFPSEEEQYVIYKKLVDGMPGKEITFRTLDIGGDKVLAYFQHVKEENPFLGMRSIRFSLKYKDIFAQQIRAILRAGHGADVRIMFPMISSLDDFLEARAVVQECLEDLKHQKIPHQKNPPLGMMVELPAVVEIIDALAREADFFSLGTNDFIQYMLAVDRTNEKVADLYLPHHPSILRSFKKIVEAVQKEKKDISICGDMADDERYTAYFLGIGLRRFSLNAQHIPKIQAAIARIDLKEAEQQTAAVLAQDRVSAVSKMLAKHNTPQIQ